MFEPESKDIIFRIFIRFFALVYMVGATVFLLHVKPVMEMPVIFLCISLWIFIVMHYFVSNGWLSESIIDTELKHNTAKKQYSLANIFIGFFGTVGFLIIGITAKTELFFLIIIAGYIFYMATAYLWVYLLTKAIRYFYPQKQVKDEFSKS